MNIDKGNQSQPGPDMDTIGHVGVNDTTSVYTLKVNDNVGKPFSFTTNQDGEAWIVVGTDSGFESTTAIYYTNINVTFELITGIGELAPSVFVEVFPNPTTGPLQLQTKGSTVIQDMTVFDMRGKQVFQMRNPNSEIVLPLPAGIYFLHIRTLNGVEFKRIAVQ